MPFSVAAAVAPAVIGLAGSALQSGAASKGGGDAQAALAQSRQDLMPWMTAGGNALGPAQNLLGLNGQAAADAAMANYQRSPGYQWQFGEGLRAVDAGAAAKGMLRSGATLKAEQTWGAGLADSDFQQYYKNLMGLSGQGLDAAKAGAGVGSDSAKASLGQGDAQSSIFGNATAGLGSTLAGLSGNPKINSLFGGYQTTGPGTYQIGPGPGMISG